ncbi:hypothetical protein AVEN_117723-1 [Araneus ventricosus]|uniref:Uncharacterized protein n=1 Tax=Araneus ventricosus TaxID=182803 RepID=A0A4Y2P568_ARAVE|nr:hypothetical protein AVEN_117723-1 [Araneus ventricosus]
MFCQKARPNFFPRKADCGRLIFCQAWQPLPMSVMSRSVDAADPSLICHDPPLSTQLIQVSLSRTSRYERQTDTRFWTSLILARHRFLLAPLLFNLDASQSRTPHATLAHRLPSQANSSEGLSQMKQ